MPRLDRYILLKYLKTFLMAMALIIVIVITFDVSEKLDDFLGGHAPLGEIIYKYYLNFIPYYANLFSALFVFISVIFFTSKMAGNTEIIAILGSGISYRRLMRPYFYGSLIVALVLLFGNFVIPVNNRTLLPSRKTTSTLASHQLLQQPPLPGQAGVQVYAESYDAKPLRVNQFSRDVYDRRPLAGDRISCSNIQYDTLTGKWDCLDFVHRTIDGNREHLPQRGKSATQPRHLPTTSTWAARRCHHHEHPSSSTTS